MQFLVKTFNLKKNLLYKKVLSHSNLPSEYVEFKIGYIIVARQIYCCFQSHRLQAGRDLVYF